MTMTECNCTVADQRRLGPHHKRYCNFHAWVIAYIVPVPADSVEESLLLRMLAWWWGR